MRDGERERRERERERESVCVRGDKDGEGDMENDTLIFLILNMYKNESNLKLSCR